MAMLKINGLAMPAPSAMKVKLFDLSSGAERNAAGETVMDRVAVKRKLELSWSHLREDELAVLLGAVGAEAFFTAEYPDPLGEGMRSAVFCCGDRCAGVLRREGGTPIWTDVEMSWTEK